jgi:hypothetical protein
MASSIERRSLEAKTGIWKARALAKQKWLEQALAEPTTTPQQAARRMAWIKRALKIVKRAQSRIAYQTGLIDAYAQHLNALEMTLLSEAEQKTRSGSPTVGTQEST